jgi:hypothetical protein
MAQENTIFQISTSSNRSFFKGAALNFLISDKKLPASKASESYIVSVVFKAAIKQRSLKTELLSDDLPLQHYSNVILKYIIGRCFKY